MQGALAIVSHSAEVMPQHIKWMWHGFNNPFIEITGDRAEGRWLLMAFSIPRSNLRWRALEGM
jgi:hypothetical protein